MESSSGTPECPLSREEIKARRKIRNKLKREQKRIEKPNRDAQTPQATQKLLHSATTGHVAVITEGVFNHFNNTDISQPYQTNKQRKRQESVVNLCELQAQQSSYNSVLRSSSKQSNTPEIHPAQAVSNRLDKELPVITKGKHSAKIKPKQLSTLKKAVLESATNCDSEVEYVNYVQNIVTDQLECLTTEFLKHIVRFQENYYKKDPTKAAIKRRYIVGLHQLKKYLALKKIQAFIVATDLKLRSGDPIHLLIQELVNLANENGIPFVFALKRRQLGHISLKHLPVTCFGVLNYDGLNEKFQMLLQEISNCKESFAKECSNNEEHEETVYRELLKNLKAQLVT